MGLTPYQRKRDFNKTPEPEGSASPSSSGRIFVIQKHAARRLHYDLRLELDGVLKSWAVPKGPSLDPKDKRLAVQVEDHPIEYADFEGIIAQNEYGGGTVLVWDYGQWEPQGDPQQDYEAGELKFRLHGHKLKGGWVLVRTSRQQQPDKIEWLLIKHRDAEAVPGASGRITEDQPASVLTGRRIEQVAADRNRIWTSGGEATASASTSAPAKESRTTGAQGVSPADSVDSTDSTNSAESKKTADAIDPAGLTGARKAAQPTNFLPQLARLADSPPPGAGWLHEIKYDGYRLLCFKQGAQVRLHTRRGNDWSARFAAIVPEASNLPIEQAVLDGEAVIQRSDGTTDFQALQNYLQEGKKNGVLRFYVFDLPFCQGYDLTAVPLADRKKMLNHILRRQQPTSVIRPGSEIFGQGPAVFERACELGVEGILSKKIDGPYRQGRTADWLKTKCRHQQEFVIGGYSISDAAPAGLGSLLLGYYQFDDGPAEAEADTDTQAETENRFAQRRLVYAGKVGTGFSDRERADLRNRLEALQQDRPAFDNPPRQKTVRWVEPQLVAEIVFAGWTHEMVLRHAAYKGLREDKPAQQVVLETGPAQMSAQMSAQMPANMPEQAAEPAQAARPSSPSGVRIAGVRLTNPDRVLYPQSNRTKLDLARFYEQIGDRMLPYIINRPLTLVRCPEGIGGTCFYQKRITENLPESLKGTVVREGQKERTYIYITDLAGLISLVQIGALEIHPWGSRIGSLENPDTLIFDLDPDPALDWEHVIHAAWHLYGILQERGLTSFVKTSGGKGLHVQVPVGGNSSWEKVSGFARETAVGLASDMPQRYTASPRKASRRGKIFIDYMRNARGATSIAPYCVRSRPGAPLSMPLDWLELSHRIGPEHFNANNALERLTAAGSDPWKSYSQARQENIRNLAQHALLQPTD